MTADPPLMTADPPLMTVDPRAGVRSAAVLLRGP
jgi:hypothetical protein